MALAPACPYSQRSRNGADRRPPVAAQRMLDPGCFPRSSSLRTKLSPAIFGTAEKANCRRHSRDRLEGSRTERYGKSLSECRFVSEAWGLADLFYKAFRLRFQELVSLGSRKIGISFACLSPR
jgi:hypothetical protein